MTAPTQFQSAPTVSAAMLFRLDKALLVLWLLPILALDTLVTVENQPRLRKLGTATAIAALLGFAYVFTRPLVANMAWGMTLTRLLGFVLFAFSGRIQGTKMIDFVAKKLGSRKGGVYGHSAAFPSDVHFSAQDFYAKLETDIGAKAWPGVQLSRIDWSEAGVLSHKREYLRVIRQR
ncbi:MAG: hypothetical protein ACLQVY_09180 [Limisphaerales bacterium]